LPVHSTLSHVFKKNVGLFYLLVLWIISILQTQKKYIFQCQLNEMFLFALIKMIYGGWGFFPPVIPVPESSLRPAAVVLLALN
jgi:hypothetical protein